MRADGGHAEALHPRIRHRPSRRHGVGGGARGRGHDETVGAVGRHGVAVLGQLNVHDAGHRSVGDDGVVEAVHLLACLAGGVQHLHVEHRALFQAVVGGDVPLGGHPIKETAQKLQLSHLQLGHVPHPTQVDAQDGGLPLGRAAGGLQDGAVTAQDDEQIRRGVQLVHGEEGKGHAPAVHAKHLVSVEGGHHDLAGVRRKPLSHLHGGPRLLVYVKIGYQRDSLDLGHMFTCFPGRHRALPCTRLRTFLQKGP